MTPSDVSLRTFTWRATACHVVTYTIAGLIASTLFDYASWWETEPMANMRPLDSPMVALGPSLQVFRGVLMGLVLYPFRQVLLDEGRGWLKLWLLLAVLGILSTYGPAPGSIEGMIYTDLPLPFHVFGVPEVYGQSLAFAACFVGWHRRPHKAWGLVMGVLMVLTVLVSAAGVFLAPLAEAQG